MARAFMYDPRLVPASHVVSIPVNDGDHHGLENSWYTFPGASSV